MRIRCTVSYVALGSLSRGNRRDMKIFLIRHSSTEGNLKRKYIGQTDEPLCGEGVRLLKDCCARNLYPNAERIYTSPMKRCIETAEIIYPGRTFTVIEELRECDFGIFENKNYEELADCPQYQEWVDSGGMLPFPGGEDRKTFAARSVRGFRHAVRECMEEGISSAAFIVHGGTVMGIMEKYAVPRGDYYDYQLGNGEGYELVISGNVSCVGGICAGSDIRGSGMDVSSGTDYRTFDRCIGKNYKKLFSKDEKR